MNVCASQVFQIDFQELLSMLGEHEFRVDHTFMYPATIIVAYACESANVLLDLKKPG